MDSTRRQPGNGVGLSTSSPRLPSLYATPWDTLIKIVYWLVDLVIAGYTILCTPNALERWDLQGLGGTRYLSFNTERGTKQGGIQAH